MNIKLLLLVIFSIVSVGSYAQSFEKRVDGLLNEKYPSTGPGASALVAIRGKVVYHKAFGKANLELDIPMKKEMVFAMGSISKQFTAIAILMLMEQGKINLDDSITKFIQDYPTNGTHISIRHLLTHTSGISRSITQNPWNANIQKHEFDIPSFIDYFKNEPNAFAPGKKFQYNNFGYIILGHIVEIVSGMPFKEFVANNIFQPLKMHSSRSADEFEIVKNRAYGYEKHGKYVNKQYTSSSHSVGAGSLMTTVEDLYIWNRALRNSFLISQNSLDLAFKNQQLDNGEKVNYGFGWFINEINGSPTVEHPGGDHGFRTDAIYLPEEDVFVAVFSNCSCGEPRPISTKIAAMAINKPYLDPIGRAIDIEEAYKWTGKYTFGDGSERSVVLKNNKMYWVIPNGTEIIMIPTSNNTFVLKNGLTETQFKLLDSTLINVVVKDRINVKVGVKPYTKRSEMSLPAHAMNKYVGRYKIFPEFDLTILLNDGQLTSTGTGQEAFDIFPETATRFFFKSIDAHIDFILGGDGESSGLKIIQDGVTYSATKVQ